MRRIESLAQGGEKKSGGELEAHVEITQKTAKTLHLKEQAKEKTITNYNINEVRHTF